MSIVRLPISLYDRLLKACAALAVVAAAIVAASPTPAHAQTELAREMWQVDCETGECVAYYRTTGLEIFIGKASGTQTMVAEFRVMAESSQGAPVTVRVNNGWVGAMTIETCNENFCRLAVDLANTPSLVEQFKGGNDAIVAYVASGKIIMIPFNLDGFTGVIKQVSAG